MPRRSSRPLLLLAFTVIAVAGCDREERRFRESPPSVMPEPISPTDLRAGPAVPAVPAVPVSGPYEENAFAISEGQRLYNWFNCVGCHALGGGGSGPALMDDEWIYGSDPAQVFSTIVEGRPRGMPAFGQRVSNDNVWRIVAYVRSLSGLTRKDARPGRSDDMYLAPTPQSMRPAAPRQSGVPPEDGQP